MRAFEIDGCFEEFPANGAGEMLVQFGKFVDSELNLGGLSFGEDIKHPQGLILDYMFFIFLHSQPDINITTLTSRHQ